MVSHILTAVDRIERITSGLDRDRFAADERTRLAVERCLEIVSKASRDIPQHIKDEHPDIEWRRMADAGNVYRHVYDSVDPDIVWRTVLDHVPALRIAVMAIVARHVSNG